MRTNSDEYHFEINKLLRSGKHSYWNLNAKKILTENDDLEQKGQLAW